MYGRYASRRIPGEGIGRRRLISGATGAGLAGLIAAACGGSDDAKPSGAAVAPTVEQQKLDTTAQAQPGGTYQGFVTQDVTGFDPIGATANRDRTEAGWAYSRLFKFKPGVNELSKGEVEGDIVESWEINPDALQITMKLRPNAKWDPRAPTNGRAVDSQDIKTTFERFKAQSPYRRDWFNSLSPTAPFTDVETPDARTVVIKMAYPLGAIFDYLGNTLGYFAMPREADGGFDPKREMRGSGAWMLEKYTPSAGFEYKRNPNFYVKDRPFLDGWSSPIVPEYAQQLAQFRAGNIWGGVVRQEDVLATKRDLPQLLLQQNEYGPTAPGIFFGWSGSPFLDVRVRRAIAMLIDRKTFASAYSDEDKFKAAGINLELAYDNFLGRGWGDYWLDPYGKEMGEGG